MAKNLESFSLRLDLLNDLLECYREVAPNCLLQETAWERTIAHPAKRFYVSGRQAYQRINYYMKGKTEEIDGLRDTNRRMFHDIMDVVIRIQQYPENQGLTLSKLCDIAVTMPAPCFYMTTRTMRGLFADVKYNAIDKYGRYKYRGNHLKHNGINNNYTKGSNAEHSSKRK